MNIENLTANLQKNLSEKQRYINQELESELNKHKQHLSNYFNEELNLISKNIQKLNRLLIRPILIISIICLMLPSILIVTLFYLNNKINKAQTDLQNHSLIYSRLQAKDLAKLNLFENKSILQLKIPQEQGRIFQSQNGNYILEIYKE